MTRYHRSLVEAELRRLIPRRSTILELASGTGDLLHRLASSRGLGLDLNPRMVEFASRRFPELEFRVGDAQSFDVKESFDFVIGPDPIGVLDDIGAMLECVQSVCHEQSRLIIMLPNPMLRPITRVAERLGTATLPSRSSWVSLALVERLLGLSNWEVQSRGNARSGFGPFNLVQVVVARPIRPLPQVRPLSASVVVACRNEVDNIEPTLLRIPRVGTRTEVIFVDGASTDGTKERVEEVIERYRGEKEARLILQVPDFDYVRHRGTSERPAALRGKGDAVRQGFDFATGDVLMILDADLTVSPEALLPFYRALATGICRFVNGNRLDYPMEEGAMPIVNLVGNKVFAWLFSWLLGQRMRDMNCANKALLKSDYDRIKSIGGSVGRFDPFGDFDLLFGAARLGLKMQDLPVRYRRRVAGVSKMRVSTHGWRLLGMALIAFRTLKLARWFGRS